MVNVNNVYCAPITALRVILDSKHLKEIIFLLVDAIDSSQDDILKELVRILQSLFGHAAQALTPIKLLELLYPEEKTARKQQAEDILLKTLTRIQNLTQDEKYYNSSNPKHVEASLKFKQYFSIHLDIKESFTFEGKEISSVHQVQEVRTSFQVNVSSIKKRKPSMLDVIREIKKTENTHEGQQFESLTLERKRVRGRRSETVAKLSPCIIINIDRVVFKQASVRPRRNNSAPPPPPVCSKDCTLISFTPTAEFNTGSVHVLSKIILHHGDKTQVNTGHYSCIIKEDTKDENSWCHFNDDKQSRGLSFDSVLKYCTDNSSVMTIGCFVFEL
jgi:hypothetical protein